MSLLRNCSGSILAITGLSFLLLIGAGGAAYDFGRKQLVEQRIQQAADAAALAASAMDYGVSNRDRQTMANSVFSLNYPASYFGVPRPTPAITIGTNDVTVSASTDFQTSFVRTLGIKTLLSKGRSVAQIKRDAAKLDVILVLDNSGSMASRDVGTVNSLNAVAGTHARCLEGWAALGYGPVPLPVPPFPIHCFNNISCCATFEGINGYTRLNALRYSATNFAATLMNPNPLDHRLALVTWDNFVIDSVNFTSSYATAQSVLGRMYGRAGTDSSGGLMRAKGIATLGFRSDAVHAIILMTDGRNGSDGSTEAAIAALNAESIKYCNWFKDQPRTLVFTIGFGAEINHAVRGPVIRQFMSDCATGPNGPNKPNEGTYYFAAPNAATLNAAFVAIIGSLQKVRIIE